jgi:hypothetical protein
MKDMQGLGWLKLVSNLEGQDTRILNPVEPVESYVLSLPMQTKINPHLGIVERVNLIILRSR